MILTMILAMVLVMKSCRALVLVSTNLNLGVVLLLLKAHRALLLTNTNLDLVFLGHVTLGGALGGAMAIGFTATAVVPAMLVGAALGGWYNKRYSSEPTGGDFLILEMPRNRLNHLPLFVGLLVGGYERFEQENSKHHDQKPQVKPRSLGHSSGSR